MSSHHQTRFNSGHSNCSPSPNGPDCCKPCREKIEKSIEQRNQLISQKDKLIEQLKNDNVEEKRKHCEINNEIIRSNVRYHKAVGDVQSRNQQLVKEKDQAMAELKTKEIENASLHTQVDSLKVTNDQILQKIERLLVEGITQLKNRTTTTTVTVAEPEPKTTVKSQQKKSEPIVLVEPEPEPLPPVIAIKSETKTASADVFEFSEPSQEASSQSQETTTTTQKSKRSRRKVKQEPVVVKDESPVTRKRVSKIEPFDVDMDIDEPPKILIKEEGRSRRSSTAKQVSYQEPSLRKKLRKGDEHTFGSDAEKEAAKGKKTMSAPSSPDKENMPTQEANFLRNKRNSLSGVEAKKKYL